MGGFLESPTDKMETTLALQIHEIMRGINFNCHEVICKRNKTAVCIGFALNPVMSLFNHSCDPNFGRVWLRGGQRVLGFATRPIKAGDQIFDSYSGVFAKTTKEERSPIHNRYNFECGCEACAADWPLYRELPSTVPKELKPMLKKEARNQTDFQATKAVVTKAYQVLKRPHAKLVELEEKLHAMLWGELQHYQ
jgi:hypothetical protein